MPKARMAIRINRAYTNQGWRLRLGCSEAVQIGQRSESAGTACLHDSQFLVCSNNCLTS